MRCLLACRKAELLSYFLKLLTDYRAIEAIDGYVKPIAFFAFHYKVRLKIRSIGFVVACLRDHVDEQTPRPRLCDLGERPRKGVFFVLAVGIAAERAKLGGPEAGEVSPAHCRLGSCGAYNAVSSAQRLTWIKNHKAAIRSFENCREDDRLPGIETNNSSAHRSAVVGEEVKQSRVWVVGCIRRDWVRVAVWIVCVLKIDEIFKLGDGVVIISGVKDAVGPTKLSHAAGGLVDGVEGRRSCGSGRW